MSNIKMIKNTFYYFNVDFIIKIRMPYKAFIKHVLYVNYVLFVVINNKKLLYFKYV